MYLDSSKTLKKLFQKINLRKLRLMVYLYKILVIIKLNFKHLGLLNVFQDLFQAD